MNIILLSLILLFSTAHAGNEGGGGGDPVAANFSALASYISEYLIANPTIYPSASRSAIKEVAEDIRNSLHVSSSKGKIEVIDTTDNRILFLQSSRNPLCVKISRQAWESSSQKDLLKSVRTLLVSLSEESQNDEIPLPEKPIDSYAEAYALCSQYVRLTEDTYELLNSMLDKCLTIRSIELAKQIKTSDQLLRRSVDECKSHCSYLHQKFSGGPICEDYLSQHEQNLKDMKIMTPNCL